MDLIADALLLAGALAAALYCWVLSKRVKSLNDLDAGLGSAIASLSIQVKDMQSALKTTQMATGASVSEMEELSERAERAAQNLKLMLATVQEEKAERPKKQTRLRKFAKPTAVKNIEPEPNVDPLETQAANDTSDIEPKVNSDAPVAAKTEDVTETPARKLQSDIVAKISDREQDASREELVQALQSILAASK